MPLLDVTEVLFCPEFYTTFTVNSYTEVVSSQGELVETPAIPIQVLGVVVPTSHTTLQRLAEAANMSGSVEIYTTHRLNDGRGPTGADEIVHNNARYTVMEVHDYTNFGAGFVRAVCVLRDINPPARIT